MMRLLHVDLDHSEERRIVVRGEAVQLSGSLAALPETEIELRSRSAENILLSASMLEL